MYPTSNEFKKVVKKNSRKFYWTGNIILKDETVIPFTNKDILKGSGYIHIRLESGQAMIGKDNAIAAISGQSLGSTEAWDGKIKIDESWTLLDLSHAFLLRNLVDTYQIKKEVPRPIGLTETLSRFTYQGLNFGKMKESVEYELKDEEVTNA